MTTPSCAAPTLPCCTSLDGFAFADSMNGNLACGTRAPGCRRRSAAPCPPPNFGWVGDHHNHEHVARMTIGSSLMLAHACAPLLGGHPPAIFPVPDADPAESDTVKHLVNTVNQILERLRACGVLADNITSQSRASFFNIGTTSNAFSDTFPSPDGNTVGCQPVPQITYNAVNDYVAANPTNPATPTLLRILERWDTLGVTTLLDEGTFTRLYLELYI